MDGPQSFLKLVRNPIKFRFFLLFKLPAAFFSGVRVKTIDEEHSVCSIPYKWLTQNPFRSTYFASLAMAAEMSTGLLALLHLNGRKPAVSMLVVKLEAAYHKRATGISYFTCKDGREIASAIEAAAQTGEAQTVTASSIGTNAAGEPIATFLITWSFKSRKT